MRVRHSAYGGNTGCLASRTAGLPAPLLAARPVKRSNPRFTWTRRLTGSPRSSCSLSSATWLTAVRLPALSCRWILKPVSGLREWKADEEYCHPVWPTTEERTPPPKIPGAELCAACCTFPVQTGLGWDALHPRALTRLRPAVLDRIILTLEACESSGEWPGATGTSIIVLLAKPGGGHRPIGLLPWLVRVWMRVRRDVALRWEHDNRRPFLYAGAGKGAEVASWKQAARGELAATAPVHAAYGMVLLDLVGIRARVACSPRC